MSKTTADVDSLTRLTEQLKAIVREVADRHGLRINWLNDKAAMFTPSTFRREDCDVLYEHTHLAVLGPPAPR